MAGVSLINSWATPSPPMITPKMLGKLNSMPKLPVSFARLRAKVLMPLNSSKNSPSPRPKLPDSKSKLRITWTPVSEARPSPKSCCVGSACPPVAIRNSRSVWLITAILTRPFWSAVSVTK